MVWNKEGAANLGLQPQRIDNLIDYLDRMESILDESDFTPDEREKLIETLRLEVVEVLKVAFNEGDRTIRRSAIYGLSKIGLNQSNDFFLSALSDSDEHVRGPRAAPPTLPEHPEDRSGRPVRGVPPELRHRARHDATAVAEGAAVEDLGRGLDRR